MKSEENVSDEAVVDSEENVSDEAVVDSEENVSDEKEDYESSIDVGNMAGVGPATKQKLRRAGIMNIMDLLVHNTNFLLDAIGGSKDKVEQLQDDARQKLTDLDILQKDFISADKLLEKRKEISFISTYSSNLDDLLLGGIETQAVT